MLCHALYQTTTQIVRTQGEIGILSSKLATLEGVRDIQMAWARAGATWYHGRTDEDGGWVYAGVFPIEAVPVDVLAALNAEEPGPEHMEDLERWLQSLPIIGAHYSGPGRSFSHGPRARIRGRRVIVAESGGLDI